MDKIRRTISFDLSQEEIVNKALDVAFKSDQISKLEEVFKEARTKHKAAVLALEVEVEDQLKWIRARKEDREVECEVRKNIETNTVEYWHDGRMVATRVMEIDERQLEMDSDPLSEVFTEQIDADHPEDDGAGEVIPEEPLGYTARVVGGPV